MNARPFLILLGILFLVMGCSQPHEETPFARGKTLFQEGKWDKAIQQLDLAIANNPLDSEAFLYRGQTYICKGSEHASQAIADYNEAIRLNPESYEAYYSRAIAYKKRGENQKALEDELTARRFDPNAMRNRNMYSNAAEERRLAIERAAALAPGLAADKKPSADEASESAVESFPTGRPNGRKSKPADVAGSPSSVRPKGELGSASTSSRDQVGLPGAAGRGMSLSEEMFGGAKPADVNEEPVPNNRRPTVSAPTRRRPAATDWQTHNTPPASPITPEAEVPRKESLVGKLPYGNPYLPHQSSGGYSPYAPPAQGPYSSAPSGYAPYSPYSQGSYSPYGPTGPRSTGLQSNPQGRRLPSSPYSGGRTAPGALPQPLLPYGR